MCGRQSRYNRIGQVMSQDDCPVFFEDENVDLIMVNQEACDLIPELQSYNQYEILQLNSDPIVVVNRLRDLWKEAVDAGQPITLVLQVSILKKQKKKNIRKENLMMWNF